MSLQFSESSPGVHMASWENPTKGGFRTVVIIESLGKYTLYVDGDVIDRDFDTFDAAEARAGMMLTAGRSRRMVQIAGVLVFLAVAGGTTVGIAKLLSGTSDFATATYSQSEPHSSTQPQSAAVRSNPVRTVVRNATASPVKTVVRTATTDEPARPAPSPFAPPQPTSAEHATVETAPSSAEASTAAVQTRPATEQAPPATSAGVAPQPGPRVFSAARPVFGARKDLETRPKASAARAPGPQPRFNDMKITGRTKVGGLIYVPNAYAKSNAENKSNAKNKMPTKTATTTASVVVPLPEQNPRARLRQTASLQYVSNTAVGDDIPAPETALNDELPNERETVATGTGVAPVETTPAYTGPVTRTRRSSAAKRRTPKRKTKVRHVRKKKTSKPRRRRARRVMRCMYGGCRWVAAGGYYDRQYRRHRRYR